jgi:hypothetical protein
MDMVIDQLVNPSAVTYVDESESDISTVKKSGTKNWSKKNGKHIT